MIDVKRNEYFLNEYFGNNIENMKEVLTEYKFKIENIEYIYENHHEYNLYMEDIPEEEMKAKVSNILESNSNRNKTQLLNIIREYFEDLQQEIIYSLTHNKPCPVKIYIKEIIKTNNHKTIIKDE